MLHGPTNIKKCVALLKFNRFFLRNPFTVNNLLYKVTKQLRKPFTLQWTLLILFHFTIFFLQHSNTHIDVMLKVTSFVT